jgi:hypothetical protein
MDRQGAIRHGVRGALVAALLLAAAGAGANRAVDNAASRAIAAGAPVELVRGILRRADASRARPDVVIAGLGQVEAAARDGLPPAPVAEKVLEGLAKGIPAARLTPAAKEVVGRLSTARSALGDLSGKGRLVEEAAEALRRGASTDAVGALARAARGAPAGAVEPTLRELAELGERGVADELAGTALGSLAARGYPASVVDSISGQLDELLAEGGAARDLLGEVRARALAGRPIERLVDPFGEGGPAVIRDRRAVPAGPSMGGPAGAAALPAESGATVAPSPLDRTGTAGAVADDPADAGQKRGRGHAKKAK